LNPAPPPAEHRHRWAVIDFFVEDDRPMMRQACRCGASRSIRAWDRTWEPPSTDADD
jgi:hypothetical protein